MTIAARNISTYSESPGSNTDYFPEGMNPSDVNDGSRNVQADLRGSFAELPWFEHGHTITYVSGTSFTVSGDVTAIYTVARRIRANGSGTGTIAGAIATSSYSSPNTTITVTWDSGALSNESLRVWTYIFTDNAGQDADTLDGYHAVAFPRKAENAAITGNWTSTGTWNGIELNPRTATDTVTVGASGADQTTVNAAIEAIENRIPVLYRKSGFIIKVQTIAGFTMAEQVLSRYGKDLSYIHITSVDAEVSVTRSALTDQIDSQSIYPVFGAARNSAIPTIDALFSMDSSGTATGRTGVYLVGNCTGSILAARGVKNCGADGLSVQRGSVCDAHQSNFSGAGEAGIYAGRSSRIDAALTNVSNSKFGFRVQRKSVIDAHSGANASGCSEYAIYLLDGGEINASGVNGSSAGIHGLYALAGTSCTAPNGNFSGATTDAVRAQAANHINIESANCSSAGQYGLYAFYATTVNANSVDVTDYGTQGIRGLDGVVISAASSNCQQSGSDQNTDIVAGGGGAIINARGATGGTNLTKNASPSASGLIMG